MKHSFQHQVPRINFGQISALVATLSQGEFSLSVRCRVTTASIRSGYNFNVGANCGFQVLSIFPAISVKRLFCHPLLHGLRLSSVIREKPTVDGRSFYFLA